MKRRSFISLSVAFAGGYSTIFAQETNASTKLETVALLPGPAWASGIGVSPTGRIFLTFPRLDAQLAEYTLAELKEGLAVPYPNASVSRLDKSRPADSFISAQGAIADSKNRLWVIDTASLRSSPIIPGQPKLVCFDLNSDRIIRTFTFPPNIVAPTTYLNDFRLDFSRNLAYITDSGDKSPNGIIVLDLASGKSWRKLNGHKSVKAPNIAPIVDGKAFMKRPKGGSPDYDRSGCNGIALTPDGKTLYWAAEASYDLYAASADAIADPSVPDSEVAKTVQKIPRSNFASDGLEMDTQNRLYLSDLTNNAIQRRSVDGRYETLISDRRIIWPDCLRLARDGYLYFTANQVNRRPDFNEGVDRRKPPYALFRIKVDAMPTS